MHLFLTYRNNSDSNICKVENWWNFCLSLRYGVVEFQPCWEFVNLIGYISQCMVLTHNYSLLGVDDHHSIRSVSVYTQSINCTKEIWTKCWKINTVLQKHVLRHICIWNQMRNTINSIFQYTHNTKIRISNEET